MSYRFLGAQLAKSGWRRERRPWRRRRQNRGSAREARPAAARPGAGGSHQCRGEPEARRPLRNELPRDADDVRRSEAGDIDAASVISGQCVKPDAALQVNRPSAAVRIRVRRRPEPLPGRPTSAPRCSLSSPQNALVGHLVRGHGRLLTERHRPTLPERNAPWYGNLTMSFTVFRPHSGSSPYRRS